MRTWNSSAVVHFHFQIQFLGYATCFQQGGLLVVQAGDPALQVGALGTTEQFADRLVGGVDMPFLHLDAAHLAREAHNAYVVARSALHSHHVALGHFETVRQTEKFLAVILETHLDTVERLVARLSDAAHPVARGHLAAAAGLRLADRHVRLGATLASAGQEHRLVILHPRQRGVRLKIGVYRVFGSHVFTEDVHILFFLAFLLLLLLPFATVADKRLHILGGGHVVVIVLDNGGSLCRTGFLFL